MNEITVDEFVEFIKKNRKALHRKTDNGFVNTKVTVNRRTNLFTIDGKKRNLYGYRYHEYYDGTFKGVHFRTNGFPLGNDYEGVLAI